jgi:hypothetical protein
MPAMQTTARPEPNSDGSRTEPNPDRVWVPVPMAARMLGLGERATLKRIHAGALESRRDGRQWWVRLPGASEPNEPNRNGSRTEPAAEPNRTRPAKRTRTEPDSQALVLAVERATAPIIAQLTTVTAQLADVNAQLVTAAERAARAEGERDAAQLQLAGLRTEKGDAGAAELHQLRQQTATEIHRLRMIVLGFAVVLLLTVLAMLFRPPTAIVQFEGLPAATPTRSASVM